MASTSFNDSVNTGKADGSLVQNVQEVEPSSSSQAEIEENERKARVNAAWEQMNRGMSVKKLPLSFSSKPPSNRNKTQPENSYNWMAALGLSPKPASSGKDMPQKRPSAIQDGTSEEAKQLAAAALSAVKDAAAASAAASRGKIEITEVRDFAGENIEVKKLVDANSKEAAEKAVAPAGPPTGLDAVLEQIRKKPKLSVLDKTKKDWGEFKEETKGLEDELDAYKKSSNQYLERVSFLERTDLREFEREKAGRLALQAKRKPDMREDF
ncbi:hypothetical protein MRB53_028966 [Persea americana]|uniref:Uncharacterized protein n=1 Tax=Persea americana TaxID=3435 RepID=A0ACC2KHD6_PERAE|nr:hypothetical protein MRB53_028966 [Persea americana]